MTTEQMQVRNWMQNFGQDCPPKPTIPSLEVRKLRAKLCVEELMELIKALGFTLCLKTECGGFVYDIKTEDWIFVEDQTPNLVEIADGAEDLKVVTEGTLVACGLVVEPPNRKESGIMVPYLNINKDPLFNEVMRSNESKMWTNEEVMQDFGTCNPLKPSLTHGKLITCVSDNKWVVKDADGKCLKSPSYSPANLQPIIEEMSK